MALLAAASAFFSTSEAALFSLQARDRRALNKGTTAERIALGLLNDPDRLLMAILFWNLIVNVVYFALASIVSLRLERQERHTEAGLMAICSLLAIILLSEMIPKTVGVLAPRSVVRLVTLPLAAAVRSFRPMEPYFSSVIRLLRRLIFPSFQSEPFLAIRDLEQAISVSTADEELLAQERIALQNIVLLSDLRAEELMRPRTQYQAFSPPVNLDDLGGQRTRSGYLLVTELDTDEISAAIALSRMPTVPRHHLEQYARPVVYVPWCASVADIFDELQRQELEVAAVVNELGETIGIVTLEDLLQTIFEDQASRSHRLLETFPIRRLGENTWLVTGMTSLRRLSREFKTPLPPMKSRTVAGLIQELLGRFPEVGEEIHWQEFQFRVAEVDALGQLSVELQLTEVPGEEP